MKPVYSQLRMDSQSRSFSSARRVALLSWMGPKLAAMGAQQHPSKRDRAFVAATVERLLEERAAAGRLPPGRIQEATHACGLSRATLLRYLAAGAAAEPKPPRRWEWNADARAAYYRAGGNVTLARAMLAEQDLPALSTMYRASIRDFSPDERALARHGERAAQAKRFVTQVEELHRNETWYADHKLLDVAVVPPGGSKPRRAWMTVLVDGYSRRAVGASLSLTPNQGHVLGALGMAIRECGAPRVLVFDRGREFLAKAVSDHAAAVGYLARATRAYTPQHKGKVERFHQTINRELVHRLGGVVDPAVNVRDAPLLGAVKPVPWDVMIGTFYEALRSYNEDRAHRGLSGQTPQAVYDADMTPQRDVDASILRRFVLSAERRKISEFGIRFRGRHYWSAELDGYRGDSVEIRFAQDDQRELHVYRDGQFWCTAKLVDPASPEQHAAVLTARRDHVERQRKDLNRARRRQREAWKSVSESGTVVNTTPITQADFEREVVDHDDELRGVLETLGIETDLAGRDCSE